MATEITPEFLDALARDISYSDRLAEAAGVSTGYVTTSRASALVEALRGAWKERDELKERFSKYGSHVLDPEGRSCAVFWPNLAPAAQAQVWNTGECTCGLAALIQAHHKGGD